MPNTNKHNTTQISGSIINKISHERSDNFSDEVVVLSRHSGFANAGVQFGALEGRGADAQGVSSRVGTIGDAGSPTGSTLSSFLDRCLQRGYQHAEPRLYNLGMGTSSRFAARGCNDVGRKSGDRRDELGDGAARCERYGSRSLDVSDHGLFRRLVSRLGSGGAGRFVGSSDRVVMRGGSGPLDSFVTESMEELSRESFEAHAMAGVINGFLARNLGIDVGAQRRGMVAAAESVLGVAYGGSYSMTRLLGGAMVRVAIGERALFSSWSVGGFIAANNAITQGSAMADFFNSVCYPASEVTVECVDPVGAAYAVACAIMSHGGVVDKRRFISSLLVRVGEVGDEVDEWGTLRFIGHCVRRCEFTDAQVDMCAQFVSHVEPLVFGAVRVEPLSVRLVVAYAQGLVTEASRDQQLLEAIGCAVLYRAAIFQAWTDDMTAGEYMRVHEAVSDEGRVGRWFAGTVVGHGIISQMAIVRRTVEQYRVFVLVLGVLSVHLGDQAMYEFCTHLEFQQLWDDHN